MKRRFWQLIALFALTAALLRAQGTITTVVGNSKCCNSADGTQAVNIWLPSAGGITMDQQGNLYIWDVSSSKVRKVSTSGVVTTVAGNGTPGYSGDGGPATSAELFASGSISGVAVDAVGNLYISDGQNHVVRKVNAAGIISTVAGNGSSGFSGDGGPATSAQLFYPSGIALDSAGNLYIADSSNNRVRKVSTSGTITTVAGNGNATYSGDGVPATATAVNRPEGLTVDGAGNLYISETSESRVRKVDAAGIISTIAGQTKKTSGFSGDGGPATAATFAGPIGMAVDATGNLFIADNSNARIRKVDAAGIITTYAGITGNASTPIGDGGPATSAYLGNTKDVVIDPAGNLYLTSSAGGIVRIRKVTAGAGLLVNPKSLSFSYTIGGTTPQAQTVAVTSAGPALGFSAYASTTSGSNWLSVAPGGGTTPATVTVSVNPAGIPGGVYQGAVTLTPSSSGSASQTFAVTLTVTGAGAPTFTSASVLNALGYQAKLAPDTVFVIFGSGMGPANLAAGTGPNYPATLGGTSVTFTPAAGGTAVPAKMVYSSAGQIAGLLPSSIAPGTYAVRVTYNSLVSAPQNVTVVARSLGIATANSAGTGTAQATIGNINGGVSLTRFTSGNVAFGGLNWTLSPAHPGDTLVLWGTGGGADPANDTGGTSGDQTQAGNFNVIVSGRSITPLYAGASSGYPGLWQVNFTLPPDITADCFASVEVSAGGELSNLATIPIAPAGQSYCSDAELSETALAQLDAGGTVALGGLSVVKLTSTSSFVTTAGGTPSVTTTPVEEAAGSIALYTAAEYASLFGGIKIGACVVNDRTASAAARNPAQPQGYLDLGSRLPLAGPGVAAGAALGIATANPGPVYALTLPNGTLSGGGKYTITGGGGAGAGPFSASIVLPTSFSIAGWDSLNSIDRTKPLTLNWTSTGTDQVSIIGSTSAVAGKDASNNNIIHTVSFTCQVPAAPGSYTIPAAVLSYLLPASMVAGTNGSAILAVEAMNVQVLTVPLVSSGTVPYAAITGLLGYSRNLAVQ